MRAQVVQHGLAVVEQGLDVDQLQRPFAVQKHTFTDLKAADALKREQLSAFEVAWPRRPQYSVRMRDKRGRDRIAAQRRLHQNFAQLQAAPRPDDDSLATLVALGI